MGVGFHLLAKSAAFDIFSDVSAHSRPPEVSLNKFFCLITARVSGSGMIMMKSEDTVSSVRGNIGSSFEKEDVAIYTPVRKG